LNTLRKLSASAVVLSSGRNVAVRFASGDRFANQTTSHADVVALVEQIAPPEARRLLRLGSEAQFRYEYQAQVHTVLVEPTPDAWRVTLEPEEAEVATTLPNMPAPQVRPASEPASSPAAGGRAFPAGWPAAAPAGPEVRPIEPARPAEAAPVRPTAPAPAASSAPSAATVGAGAIERLLVRMRELKASDLHLRAGFPPFLRIDGKLQPLRDHPPFNPDDLRARLSELAPEENRREFEERSDTDFAYAVPGVARFRANLLYDRHGPGGVFRMIPYRILSPEEIGLPKPVLEVCSLQKGLVLVTGPTGSGKSTTLATLIDEVNRTRQDHILTIEDPIEFVHESKGCLVTQREVHSHTGSFKDALRAALREDPDIILVGEMRDLETISMAVETAETGHLVFGTLHTTSAPSTIDRIIDQFPADRQEQIRQMLAESLQVVIAQTLCRRIGGGRVAAYEILFVSSAVSNLIRERKTFQIPSLMQTGRGKGMMTLNDSLLDLVRRGLVEPREAYLKSVAKAEFKALLAKEGLEVTTQAAA
jgi:twitching motility protein PilT